MITSEIALSPVVPAVPRSAEREKWEREQRAFFRMLGSLLTSYQGQYVAIHDRAVVASGPDVVAVALQAYSAHGRQPIYVDLVTDHPVPAVRMPHYHQPTGPV